MSADPGLNATPRPARCGLVLVVAAGLWLTALSASAGGAAGAPAGAASGVPSEVPSGDPWLDRVRRFEPGTSAGFGAASMPDIVLGPPQGAGATAGSLDVVSLGSGGVLEVRFADNAVVDGPGDDLVLYENAFHANDESGPLFTEYAFVEVSRDGRTWQAFPYNAETGEGLAGRSPVFANSDNTIDPLSPEGGGDRFDIADLGLDYVTAVRLTDAGDLVDDYGNHSFAGTKGGFDLDAGAALHSTPLASIAGIVTMGGQPKAGVRVRVRALSEQRWRQRKTRDDGSYAFHCLLPDGDFVVRAGRRRQVQQQTQVFLGLEQMQAQADFALP